MGTLTTRARYYAPSKTLFTTPRGRIRCPYVAIPIPGSRPFVCRRDMFETVTRGINITDTALETSPAGVWQLTIVHRTGRTRGRYVFNNLLQTKYAGNYEYQRFREDMAAWAEHQRAKRIQPKLTPRQAKFATQIRRLEKELNGYKYLRIPEHPFQYRQRYADSTDAYVREQEQAWTRDKNVRKLTAHIAGLVLDRHITGTSAYKRLRDAGYTVKRYGDITASYREHYHISSETDYWRQLYRHVNSAEKPGWRKEDMDDRLDKCLERHAEARWEYLAERRQRDALVVQLAALQQLAIVQPVADENGLAA